MCGQAAVAAEPPLPRSQSRGGFRRPQAGGANPVGALPLSRAGGGGGGEFVWIWRHQCPCGASRCPAAVGPGGPRGSAAFAAGDAVGPQRPGLGGRGWRVAAADRGPAQLAAGRSGGFVESGPHPLSAAGGVSGGRQAPVDGPTPGPGGRSPGGLPGLAGGPGLAPARKAGLAGGRPGVPGHGHWYWHGHGPGAARPPRVSGGLGAGHQPAQPNRLQPGSFW